MTKTLLIVGIVLFLVGPCLVLPFLLAEFRIHDEVQRMSGLVGSPCDSVNDVASFSPLFAAESETITVKVTLKNKGRYGCPAHVGLINSAFDASPAEQRREMVLDPDKTYQYLWILTPKKTGTFEVGTYVTTDERYYHLTTGKITVTNALGLTSFQMQLASVVGTFLGPILTLPWWLEKRKASSGKKSKKKKRPKS